MAVDDPTVVAYRAWMAELEQFRDDLIAREHRMPNLLFDQVLDYLHRRISRRQLPDAAVSRFFTSNKEAVAA